MIPHPQLANFREAFRRHAAGVAIITASDGVWPVGFTATSLASLSAEPPRLTFNMSVTSSSWPTIVEAPHVGVHVLADENKDLAHRFAHGTNRFAGTEFRLGPSGVPILKEASCWLIARIAIRVPLGANAVVVADVVDGGFSDTSDPLLYHHGNFSTAQRL